MIATLETQAKENNHLQHILQKSDDSKISVYQYESVKTDLLSSQSQNAALKTQLAITVAEKDSLFSNLLDIKNSLVFVMAIVDKKYQNTEYVVNQKMSALEDKVMRVQDVIKETVQYSTRTYYMEETRKLKADKARLDKERRVFKDKLKVARKKIEEMEAQQWEGGDNGGAATNINLINFKKGKIVMDEDDNQLY